MHLKPEAAQGQTCYFCNEVIVSFKNYRQTLELLLIFSLFFLSNMLAFAYAFWLVPVLVLLVTIVWLLLTALTVWLLNKHDLISEFVEIMKRNWLVLPFLIFSAFSIVWSVKPDISFYRWLVLLCTLITGGYIGLRYRMQEIIRLLSVFGIYILLISTFFVFLIPDIGIMNYYSIQGAWSGLYWHKNHMGMVAAFINLLFLIHVIDSRRSKRENLLFWGLLYLFSFVFIYQTDSVASYLTVILMHGLVALGLLFLRFGAKIRRVHYWIFALVLVFAALLLYLNIESFLGIFNRNTTLTGRVPMWNYLFTAYIDERPLGGYGFNAFWYVKSHQEATQQAAGYPDTIIIADNGFIDILVNTGYIGLSLFVIFYFGLWWRAAQYARHAKDIYGLFPLLLMFYTFVANISWSLIFENEGFFMLAMISILFCISAETTSLRSPQIIS
jgi:O-antigen ligase